MKKYHYHDLHNVLNDLHNALSAHENGLISDVEMLNALTAFQRRLVFFMGDKETKEAESKVNRPTHLGACPTCGAVGSGTLKD